MRVLVARIKLKSYLAIVKEIFKNKRYRIITLQLICWGVILATTIFWGLGLDVESINLFAAANLLINIFAFTIIYIFNDLIFIPKYLFQNNRSNYFFSNFILVAILLFTSYFISSCGLFDSLRPADMPPKHFNGYMHIVREVISNVLMIGLVTAMKLAKRLEKSEKALRDAESARVKAELDNLRSQINPHFLLNTLNNIYALTEIDTQKAQKTIKELSDLLRYILYDNLNERVSLQGEVRFLKTYIELMSIRLPRRVEVKTEFNISDNCQTQIAPLIFISLVENAFKHSVSAEGEGFIDIHFEDDTQSGEVILSITNSNNAKSDCDKSGHGIGLEQVRRRLELTYPNAHSWVVEADDTRYKSTLKLIS